MELGYVVAEYAVENNGILFYPVYLSNSLYGYDIEKNISVRIGALCQKLEGKAGRLYKASISLNNKIFMFPWCSAPVLDILDLETKEISYIDLESYIDDSYKKLNFKFAECFSYENSIYAIGMTFPAIVKVDSRTEEITIIDDWIKKYPADDSGFNLGYGISIDEYRYIPMYTRNAFLKMNMKTNDVEVIEICGDYNGFTNIVQGQSDDLYLLERFTNRLIHIEKNGGFISDIFVPDCPPKEKDRLYFDYIQRENGGFYLFPVRSEHIYYYDFDLCEFEICKEFEEIMQRELGDRSRHARRVYSFWAGENRVYVVETKSKRWNLINLSTREIHSFKIRQAINGVAKWWNRGVSESENETLIDLINYVTNQHLYENEMDYIRVFMTNGNMKRS